MASGLGARLGAAVAWAKGPKSQWEKTMLDVCITAALNILDFYSDLLVILKYACVVDSGLSLKCGDDQTSQTCQPHYWWFGIGLTLLVISNLAQSCLWVFMIQRDFRFNRPLCAAIGLFMTAFSQTSYVVDVYLAAVGRATNQEWARQQALRGKLIREMLTKSLESAPQLYFQCYVLFALGAHGEPAQVASVVISILSLAYGCTKIFALDPDLSTRMRAYKRMTTFRGLALICLFQALDLAWRAGATALVLTEASRPVGICVLLAFCLAFIVCYATNFDSRSIVCRICVAILFGTLLAHLTPGELLQLGSEERRDLRFTGPPRLALLRWCEGLACVAVAFGAAKTACGHTPVREAWALLVCVLSSALLYLVLQPGHLIC